MAVGQSLLLTFGTFVGVLWFFAQLPDIISKWQSKELQKTKRETLFLMHFAHLAWLLYAIQKWDYDWFIPSMLQAIVSVGHIALVYALLRVEGKMIAKYALAVPLVFLVIWRATPIFMVGSLAALLEIANQITYTRTLSEVRSTSGVTENSKYSCLLRLIQCIIWTTFGYLRIDYFLTSAFALGALLNGAELLQQVTVPKRRRGE